MIDNNIKIINLYLIVRYMGVENWFLTREEAYDNLQWYNNENEDMIIEIQSFEGSHEHVAALENT